MKKIKQIMCVIDPTADAQPAMHRAEWMARQTNAELEIFVCCYNDYMSCERLFDAPSLEKARDEVIRAYEKRLEKIAEPLRNSGPIVKTTAVWDHPLHEAIVRHAAAIGADLIFKDTHHHSAMARALFTNTDWNLIRTCATPLWLVKAREISENPLFIAAIDPMNEHDKPAALDDEILVLGKFFAEVSKGKISAFHAYDPRIAVATASAYVPMLLPFDEMDKKLREQHAKRFVEVVEFHGIGNDQCHLISGVAHEELPELVRKLDAAVVIMGAISRSRWKRLFVGATAERTLEHLPCDLLIVKPDWFRTPDEILEERAA